MDETYLHQPVLLKECLDFLSIRPDSVIVDVTCGEGGHSLEIAKRNPEGKLICIDRNPEILSRAKERLSGYTQIVYYNTTFDRLPDVLSGEKTKGKEQDVQGLDRARDGQAADGILADLGISMFHLKNEALGFSYTDTASLDMRLDRDTPLTAAMVVNNYREEDLADILYQYGEEYESRRIARAIVRERPIKNAYELSETVRKAKKHVSAGKGRVKTHPATKTFQALRIFVNKELEILESFIPLAVDNLKEGGKLVVISYHSLEDRIVKHGFRAMESAGLGRVLTKKPVTAAEEEVAQNRAARSAKLRVFLKERQEE